MAPASGQEPRRVTLFEAPARKPRLVLEEKQVQVLVLHSQRLHAPRGLSDPEEAGRPGVQKAEH